MVEQTNQPNYSGLAKAQAAIPAVIKPQTSGNRGAYADLAAVLAPIRKALNEHELILSQQLEDGAMITRVRDANGHTVLEGSWPIQQEDAKRAGGPSQALGMACTYARRYSALMLFGVAAGDPDLDDGPPQGQQQHPPPQGNRQPKPKPEPKPEQDRALTAEETEKFAAVVNEFAARVDPGAIELVLEQAGVDLGGDQPIMRSAAKRVRDELTQMWNEATQSNKED